ncbi:unnamed protein product [Closterium sp. NIES-53]
MCRQSYRCPAQTNGNDCGVFVCIYVYKLVATDFKHLEGLPALTYGTGKFCRNLHGDLVHQAMRTLFGQLVQEKCLIPDQDPPLASSSNSPLPREYLALSAKLREVSAELGNTQIHIKSGEDETYRVECRVQDLAKEMKAMWEELERVKELARAPGHIPRGVPIVDGATSSHRGSAWDMQDRGGDAQTMLQASAVVRQLLGGFPMQDHSPLGRGPAVMPSLLPNAKPTLALSEMNS